MRARLNVLLFLLSLLLVPSIPDAQPSRPTPPVSPPAEAPRDPLGRDTPRGAVVGFIKAAQQDDYTRAAEYLDSRYSAARNMQLARELKGVLDRGLTVNLDLLSAKPEGDPSASPRSDRQLIGTVTTETGSLDILLDRVYRSAGPPIWLFSAETLKRVSAIYAEIGPAWIESFLPRPLLERRLGNYPLWVVLSTLLGIPLAFLVAGLLSRALIPVLRPAIRYLTKEQDDRLLGRITWPIRLVILVVVLHWIVVLLELPLLARQFWGRVAVTVAVIAVAWLLVRLVDIVADLSQRHLQPMKQSGTTSMVGLLRRLAKAVVVLAAGLLLLSRAGLDLTAALAGLGVGGLAVAFAAQKTLEHLFGGVVIASDQPIRVGDFCRFGDQVGTVEDIGLRSTRIRTLERTVLTVPNGHLSSITVENFGLRDKIWFHPTIQLRYETSADQLRCVLAEIRQLLYAHPRVESQSARVRLARFGSSSLDLDIFAYVLANEYAMFLEIQEDLLLRIMDIIEDSGTGFAFPSQTTYIARDRGLDRDKTQAAVARVGQWRADKDLPFPDFTPEHIARTTDALEYPAPESARRSGASPASAGKQALFDPPAQER